MLVPGMCILEYMRSIMGIQEFSKSLYCALHSLLGNMSGCTVGWPPEIFLNKGPQNFLAEIPF